MQFVIPVNTHSRITCIYTYGEGTAERVAAAAAVFEIIEKRTMQQRDSVFPLVLPPMYIYVLLADYALRSTLHYTQRRTSPLLCSPYGVYTRTHAR